MQELLNIKVGSRLIGPSASPFIVAEMSANHLGSLKHALKIVEAAALCGVSALKIQTYEPQSMTLESKDRRFTIQGKNIWKGRSLFDLYREGHLPRAWHKEIFNRCKDFGIIGFTSVFHIKDIEWLEALEVPIYKVASFELIDLELIKALAQTKKPLILSTGMATLTEIEEAVEAAKIAGALEIILLKCTSQYPALPQEMNLKTLLDLKERFRCVVGFSDHSAGIGAAVAAVSLGASVIEKHFTMNRADGGLDADFSMEPKEMKNLVVEVERAYQALGKISYGPTSGEEDSLFFRRSLFISKDTKIGESISADNLVSLRPSLGLPPKYLRELIGKRASKNISQGTPVSFEMIEQ